MIEVAGWANIIQSSEKPGKLEMQSVLTLIKIGPLGSEVKSVAINRPDLALAGSGVSKSLNTGARS